MMRLQQLLPPTAGSPAAPGLAPAVPGVVSAPGAARPRTAPSALPRAASGCSRLLAFCILHCAFCIAAAAQAAAADPYLPWSQGRPQEAIPGLLARARAEDGWAAWYDCGLCAAAAGDRGRAAAWLIEAARRAPQRPEPRAACAALGSPLPPGWCDRLGPLAAPGAGWAGLALAIVAGAALGWAAAGRRGRRTALFAGLLALAIALPGLIALQHDRARPLAAAVRDTQLFDSAGQPLAALPAGTVLERAGAAWDGRWPVALTDGRRGLVAASDLDAGP